MTLRDFDINSLAVQETPLARSIRAQLRLSSEWRVSGMKVVTESGEYSDIYPDERKLSIPKIIEMNVWGKPTTMFPRQ